MYPIEFNKIEPITKLIKDEALLSKFNNIDEDTICEFESNKSDCGGLQEDIHAVVDIKFYDSKNKPDDSHAVCPTEYENVKGLWGLGEYERVNIKHIKQTSSDRYVYFCLKRAYVGNGYMAKFIDPMHPPKLYTSNGNMRDAKTKAERENREFVCATGSDNSNFGNTQNSNERHLCWTMTSDLKNGVLSNVGISRYEKSNGHCKSGVAKYTQFYDFDDYSYSCYCEDMNSDLGNRNKFMFCSAVSGLRKLQNDD